MKYIVALIALLIGMNCFAQTSRTNENKDSITCSKYYVTIAGMPTKPNDTTVFELSREVLLTQQGLKINPDDGRMKISGFTFSYNRGGFLNSKSTGSEKFTGEMLSSMKDIPVGTKIFFEDIKVHDTKLNVTRVMPLIKLILK